MHILKKPDLTDPKLRAKLAKGMGHNYYGEPAWPNDLLYIFPVVILGTIACIVGLSVLDPAMLCFCSVQLPPFIWESVLLCLSTSHSLSVCSEPISSKKPLAHRWGFFNVRRF